ncbi:MAG: cytochrome c oxidase subunit II [Alphaproteobacteria bacterium]|nr:cytochrome c oxidase subunit II [Alphaproteobacteria bacterium]
MSGWRKRLKRVGEAALIALAGLGASGPVSAALAAFPVDGGLGMQPAATPLAEQVHEFHNLLLYLIAGIVLFVLALLIWVVLRYNKRAHPTPKKFSHNLLVEVVWTAVPIAILVVIAVPSFKLLYKADVIPEADFTIKTVAQNWNWDYEYPDHGDFMFNSRLLPKEEAQAAGLPWLLAVNEHPVVPVGATVRLQVTAYDRLHAWTIPAFGVKIDAVPGRLNETWFQPMKEGIYYGQCSEICGPQHAYMPIMVEVVSQEAFDAWVARMQAEYAQADDAAPVAVARLERNR